MPRAKTEEAEKIRRQKITKGTKGKKNSMYGVHRYGKDAPGYKHGKRKTRLYNIWHQMKNRILNPKNPSYRRYGGRGIKICPEWLDKKNGFINFRKWALSHGYKDNLTIDRKNNDGNYEPSNVQFITRSENSRKDKDSKIRLEKNPKDIIIKSNHKQFPPYVSKP